MTVLRHRDFRNLFLGQSLSTIGDRIVFVALALYVTEIGSPTDVGLVLAAHALPLVGLVLLGGVLADRIARTRVMIASDLIRFALHAALAALIFAGGVEIWHIVVIEALFGCADAFFRPAQTGLLPQTVPEAEIQQARAASTTIETVAHLAGPLLATSLVLGLGAGWAFALDAATFLASVGFLMRVRARERGERAARQSLGAELRDGWGAVRERAWLWSIVFCFAGAVMVMFAPWFTLGPTIAEQRYGSTGVFGVLVAVMGAGTVLGALTGFRWRPLYPLRAGMLLMLPWPVAAATIALGAPLAAAVPACLAAGFGVALFEIWWHTALAERVPPHLLSRVSSYDWLVSLSLLPVGYALAGPLSEAVGESSVLTTGAALAAVLFASGLLVRDTRTLRQGSDLAFAQHH